MNWLDITVIIILAAFFITGLFRGLVRQVFSILAIGGGLAVAFMFFDILGFIL
ncbi:MAG: CvpA family protein, partial [Candidatus Dadabacteria bacterium]|nr:CvpA family protein [Candidatus Dadabacteria bacterium]NIX15010.1 CvpA family protein [Candidatus Dadabacteria bacterium]